MMKFGNGGSSIWGTGLLCGFFLAFQAMVVSASELSADEHEHENFQTAALDATRVPAPLWSARAAQNNSLKTGLSWIFGGKTQHGWSIYTPLIRRLISCTGASHSDFSQALARWQASQQRNPTGVLDQGTWSLMVQTWQSRRLKNVQPATEENLMVAPVADFYDTGRSEELRKVDRIAYAAYKKMAAAAARDSALGLGSDESGNLAAGERFFKIVSAHRSQAYQNQLRAQSPNSGRAGLASRSPHMTGKALDVYVGGSPVSTADNNRAVQTQTPLYHWLVENGETYGFYPYFYEPWHWEYRGN